VGLRPERFKADCQGLVATLKADLAAAKQERTAPTKVERKAAKAARLEAEAQAAERAKAAEERSRAQAVVGLSAADVAAARARIAKLRRRGWLRVVVVSVMLTYGGWLAYQWVRLLPMEPGNAFKECANCPEMVVVPAGSFLMGSNEYDDEKPPHRVTIRQLFAVGKFEVTFDEWDACVAQGGCTQKPDDRSWGRGRRPVINVSWDDAKQYVAWLAKLTGKPYRLLTEAEWEYAARAGTTTVYSWGNDIGTRNANCDGCGSQWDGRQTAPVGSFKPNGFGLYDMHSNVSEWVEDCYHDSYSGAPADGTAWAVSCTESRRVVRGGSWFNLPGYLRSAQRIRVPTEDRNGNLGFRLARTLTP
jgi:formylglycine-generating enzyme required for sulfatase activity